MLVARGSAREQSLDRKLTRQTEQLLQGRLKSSPVDKADLPEVRKQIREQVKAELQLVPPGYLREWQIDLGWRPRFLHDEPLHLRVKFNSAQNAPPDVYCLGRSASRGDEPRGGARR